MADILNHIKAPYFKFGCTQLSRCHELSTIYYELKEQKRNFACHYDFEIANGAIVEAVLALYTEIITLC